MKLYPTVLIPDTTTLKAIFKNDTTLMDYLVSAGHREGENYIASNSFIIKEGRLIADKILIPVENVYLLTPDEIKNIVANAFDAGTFYEYARMEENIRGTKNIFSNKETYLNNLKLD